MRAEANQTQSVKKKAADGAGGEGDGGGETVRL